MKKLTQVEKEMVAATVINKLDSLSAQRQSWQPQYDRTRATLYVLMAECLAIYMEVKGTTAEKVVLDQIKAELVNRGYQQKNGTPIINLIVRYVFDSDRRRVSGYARVLNVAISSGIKAEGFVEWVNSFGGIEEVTRTKGKTSETLQKQAKLERHITEANELLEQTLNEPLALVPKTGLSDVAGTSEWTLLIGKTLGNGQTQVLSIVPHTTPAMVDMAIKKIAQGLIDLSTNEVVSSKKEERDHAKENVLATAMPANTVKVTTTGKPPRVSSKKIKQAA